MLEPCLPASLLQPALEDAVKEVLERMFFLDADPGPPAEAETPRPAIEAHLSFQGAPPGSLLLRVDAAAARAISADFLGIAEGDLCPRQVEEVVCELANMICGDVLSRVESAVEFHLAPPRIAREPGAGAPPPGGIMTAHSVRTARGPLTAILTIEGAP